MPRQVATKDRLYAIALELFGRKGFGAVSIREICAAAGIRESSLYNHYPSKQALLDRAIEEMGAYMHSPELFERKKAAWSSLGLRDLLKGGVARSLEAWNNEHLRQLWMVLSHEQYQSEPVAALLNREQENRIAYTTDMFSHLMAAGRMRPSDARLLAATYVHAMSSLKLEYVLRLHHGMNPEGHARLIHQLAETFSAQWQC